MSLELETNVRSVSRRADMVSAAALLSSISAIPVAPFVIFSLDDSGAINRPAAVWIALIGLVALSVILSKVRQKLHAPRLRAVRVDDRGVAVDGVLVAPRERITTCRVVNQSDLDGASRVYVEILGARLAPLRIDVSTVEQGHEFLRRLGHDVSERAITFAATSVTNARFAVGLVLVVAPILLLVSGLPGPVALPILAALALATAARRLLVRRGKVDVGVDGLLLRGAGRDRYIGWREVVHAHQTRQGARLKLVKGGWLDVRAHGRMRVDRNDEVSEPGALFERISACHDAYEEPSAQPTEERLARNGRPLETWLDELTRLGSNFRSAAIASDDLERVLADPAARPSSRAGAAFALRRVNSERTDRIRLAAQGCAEPRLRMALEMTADADGDAALRGALAEVEAALDDVPAAGAVVETGLEPER